jgi:hypothetical protein
VHLLTERALGRQVYTISRAQLIIALCSTIPGDEKLKHRKYYKGQVIVDIAWLGRKSRVIVHA